MNLQNFTVIMIICGVCTQTTDASWIDGLTGLLKAVESFESVVNIFDDWVQQHQAAVLITVENFSGNKALYPIIYRKVKGNINDIIDFDVPTGHKGAIAGKQDNILSQSEGLVGFGLPDTNLKAVVYWRVPRKNVLPPDVLDQKPNKLGIGFVTSDSSDYLNNLATSDEDLSLPSLGVRDYASDVRTMQCCHDDVCLQGIMTTGNKCKVTIRFLPKNSSELFTKNAASEQSSLDQILDIPNTCTSRASSRYVFSLLPLLVILIGHAAAAY